MKPLSSQVLSWTETKKQKKKQTEKLGEQEGEKGGRGYLEIRKHVSVNPTRKHIEFKRNDERKCHQKPSLTSAE